MLIHLAMMLSKVSGLGFPSDDTAHDLSLSSLLAANTPVPTINGRRLADPSDFADKAVLKGAVDEYNANQTAAEDKYGQIETWDVSGITDMSELFKGSDINEDISSWNTKGVTTMEDMFRARGPCLHAANTPQPTTALPPQPAPPPALYDLPCDSAERGQVQPAAELRHVQRHKHEGHD